MARPLGATQLDVLRWMAESTKPHWYPLCGWSWGSHSETIRLMESLHARGLVRKQTGYKTPYNSSTVRYDLTDAGRTAAQR